VQFAGTVLDAKAPLLSPPEKGCAQRSDEYKIEISIQALLRTCMFIYFINVCLKVRIN